MRFPDNYRVNRWESLWARRSAADQSCESAWLPSFVGLHMNRRKLFRQGISEAEKSLNDPIHLLSRNRLLQIVDCPQCQCLLVPLRVGTPCQHDKRGAQVVPDEIPDNPASLGA